MAAGLLVLRTMEGVGEIVGEREGDGEVGERDEKEEEEACLASCGGEHGAAGEGERGVGGSEEFSEMREGMLEVELWEGVGVRWDRGEELGTDEREDSSWLLQVLLLGVPGDESGEAPFRGITSEGGVLVPNPISSFRELSIAYNLCSCSSRLFSGHTTPPLLLESLSLFCTRLSSDAEWLPSDLNLDNENNPLDKCPMLILLIILAFLVGLCRTCFSTTVFLSQLGAVTTSLSSGWHKVRVELLCSMGKSVVITPLK